MELSKQRVCTMVYLVVLRIVDYRFQFSVDKACSFQTCSQLDESEECLCIQSLSGTRFCLTTTDRSLWILPLGWPVIFFSADHNICRLKDLAARLVKIQWSQTHFKCFFYFFGCVEHSRMTHFNGGTIDSNLGVVVVWVAWLTLEQSELIHQERWTCYIFARWIVRMI